MIYGVVLSTIGVIFIVVSLLPTNVGRIGQFLHERFLSLVFGRSSIPAGLYCVGLGFVLLVARKKVKYLLALTCLFIPLLVVIDVLFSTTHETEVGHVIEHGAYLGYVLRSTTTNLIGSAGLVLLCCAVLLCGIILLIPKRILKGFLHRMLGYLRPKKSSLPKAGVGKTVTGARNASTVSRETMSQSATEPKNYISL